MEKILKIMIWTIIALFIQHGIFIYIEFSYLNTDSPIVIKKVEESKEEKYDETDAIDIGQNSEKISISNDGEYISYLKNGKLKVIEWDNKKLKSFSGEVEGEVLAYKWLPEEKIIIAIQKIKVDEKYYYEPVSYNVAKGEINELIDFNYNKTTIPFNNGEKVDDIEFSTSTHSLYIKIIKETGLSDIYYCNVMNIIKKVSYNKSIGKIIVPRTDTNVVFESEGKIRILNSENEIEIPKVKIARIIGIDGNDNIYYGDEKDDKIDSIYYREFENETGIWKVNYLDEPTEKTNIIVSNEGNIYYINKEGRYITDILSAKTFGYEGTFIGTYDKGFIAVSKNIIKKYER